MHHGTSEPRPSPSHMLKVRCLEKHLQSAAEMSLCSNHMISNFIIYIFNGVLRCSRDKKENMVLFLSPSSHLAIHLPFLSNGFLFYKCPFNDLIHQFYDLQETYITIRQNANSHTHPNRTTVASLPLNLYHILQSLPENGFRAGGCAAFARWAGSQRKKQEASKSPWRSRRLTVVPVLIEDS